VQHDVGAGLLPKSEITEEQYKEFYRTVSHGFDEPWATLHWRAEGALEFTGLLFVPSMKPFMPMLLQRRRRLQHLAGDVERQVVGIDHAVDEAQPVRQQLGLVGDEPAAP
jgi:hypothetical protein